jgi:hypothetical protein
MVDQEPWILLQDEDIPQAPSITRKDSEKPKEDEAFFAVVMMMTVH